MQKGLLPIPLIIITGSLIFGGVAFFVSKKFDLSKASIKYEKETNTEYNRTVDRDVIIQVSPSPKAISSPQADNAVYQSPLPSTAILFRLDSVIQESMEKLN